jgi:lactate dehydrogenase-like 2-hydroxyacid dehydrogenase
VAARAAAFGMTVAFGRHRDETTIDGHPVVSFDELLVSSDVLSVSVPLRPDTRHLIDRRALARMKRTAYLINTARGPVIDEEALAWALKDGLIAGAALDVFEREPNVHADLLGLDNVVLTPHIGSATSDTRRAMAELAAKNVVAVLGGQPALTEIR